MLKKVIISLAVLSTFLCAKEVVWFKNFQQAQNTAAAQNKPILVLMTTQECGWCKKLKKETLPHPAVHAKLSDKFIAVELDRDIDSYPNQFRTRGVPTTFFADKTGKLLIRPAIGFFDAETYESYMDDALKAKK
jgi:thioredoxin-related protein